MVMISFSRYSLDERWQPFLAANLCLIIITISNWQAGALTVPDKSLLPWDGKVEMAGLSITVYIPLPPCAPAWPAAVPPLGVMRAAP